MESINTKLDLIMQQLGKLDTLQESVEFLSKKYDELKTNLKKSFDNYDTLNKSLIKYRGTQKIQEKSITELKQRIDYLERNNLEASLNLFPVIETSNKDLRDVVVKIGQAAGVPVKAEDIINIYRRKKRANGKPGEIVIKCSSILLRNTLMTKIKEKKVTHDDIGLKCDLGRIYANEELSYEARNIFYSAFREKKDKKWKFLWTKGGRVYLKKQEGDTVIRLDTIEDLSKVQ